MVLQALSIFRTLGLLAADLDCPERACMPLFESEGWRGS
jgi:hypothetical protein